VTRSANGLLLLGIALFLALVAPGSVSAGDLPGEAGLGALKASGSAPPSAGGNGSLDYRMNAIRTAILLAGLGVFAWRNLWSSGASPRTRRAQWGLLILLAGLGYASYYQFFQYSHARGFATTDNFHYYMGSKYFEELGYFGLYECSLSALAERGLQAPGSRGMRARNLRSMELEPYSAIKEQGAHCSEDFGAERWAQFGDDLVFFAKDWPAHLQEATWHDHGYHPTPAWTLVGWMVAEIGAVTSPGTPQILSRLERVLIAMTFLAVALTFGIETACLVILIWGTGALWRYAWVGDAFFRHLWWASALLGIVALRRRGNLVGGLALASAGIFRIFPSVLALGYVAHATRNWLSTSKLDPGVLRFVGGAALGASLLGLGSFLALPQSAYPDFVAKIGDFSSMSVTNQMGLEVVAEFFFPEMPKTALAFRALVIIGFMGVAWRALRFTAAWEAAALGACLIPILSAPTNYYFSFFVATALISARRPGVGLILLIAAAGWNLTGLLLYQQYEEYAWASLIAVMASFAVVLEVIRTGDCRPSTQEPNTQEEGEVSSTAFRSQAPISG
jgi:hypothetical protein